MQTLLMLQVEKGTSVRTTLLSVTMSIRWAVEARRQGMVARWQLKDCVNKPQLVEGIMLTVMRVKSMTHRHDTLKNWREHQHPSQRQRQRQQQKQQQKQHRLQLHPRDV